MQSNVGSKSGVRKNTLRSKLAPSFTSDDFPALTSKPKTSTSSASHSASHQLPQSSPQAQPPLQPLSQSSPQPPSQSQLPNQAAQVTMHVTTRPLPVTTQPQQPNQQNQQPQKQQPSNQKQPAVTTSAPSKSNQPVRKPVVGSAGTAPMTTPPTSVKSPVVPTTKVAAAPTKTVAAAPTKTVAATTSKPGPTGVTQPQIQQQTSAQSLPIAVQSKSPPTLPTSQTSTPLYQHNVTCTPTPTANITVISMPAKSLGTQTSSQPPSATKAPPAASAVASKPFPTNSRSFGPDGKGSAAQNSNNNGPPRSALQGRQQICMMFAHGTCLLATSKDSEWCPRGVHVKQDLKNLVKPTEATVCSKVSPAKLRLIQQKWCEAGGHGQLLGVWQIKNPPLTFMYQATEHNFHTANGKVSESIDAWHGSTEDNIFSLAINGFDTSRRSGQVYGEGEYFAKNPAVSVGYCRGGSYMLLCKLLLGTSEVDHHWVENMGYYVIKHREGKVQALPMYVVRFEDTAPLTRIGAASALTRKFESLQEGEAKEVSRTLATTQRGGECACPGRPEAGMTALKTNQLWLGWLNPALGTLDDEEVRKDVEAFLAPLQVLEVKPERNGARVGAHVLLAAPITLQVYTQLAQKLYQDKWIISVDDSQRNNPLAASKICPRLAGPSKYCRGWNLSGHHEWHKACSFQHPAHLRPTHSAYYFFEPASQAKIDEITTNFMRDGSFHNGNPRIVRIRRVVNHTLERMYSRRVRFLHDKHGFVVEKDLWHGTYLSALHDILTHGLQPPSDNAPSDKCPKSGGKGMSTTLCGTDCEFCTAPHVYSSCHMFGLGVYLADSAKKSNRYVHPVANRPREYSMLYCKTLLGNPYLIEGNLLTQSAMHHRVWPSNPADCLESVAEEWDLRGHDSYYVKGQSGRFL